MFVVDGFSVKDPLSGYSGNLFVNADAIEELKLLQVGIVQNMDKQCQE